MEDHTIDDNQQTIKTEMCEAEKNYHVKSILSASKGSSIKETKLMDVKLEPGTIQENEKEEFLFSNNFKLERSIYVEESIIKAEKTSNDDLGLDEIIHGTFHKQCCNTIKIDSTVSDNQQISIKTEDEVGAVKYDPDLSSILSPSNETDTDLYDIKLESEMKQENEMEEMMSANKGKLEMEVETYDEFCNTDATSIFFEDSNQSIKIAEETCNDIIYESGIHSTKQAKNGCSRKLLICHECDYVTNNTSSLKKHQIAKHTEARPFKCDKCDYTAKIKTHLKEHQLKHTEIRPFKCDECSYQAKTKYCLKLHQRKHTEEKPFKCDKCDYSAQSKAKLNYHQMSHASKLFKCDKCDHRTNYKNNLTKHKLTHLDPGEREVYKCNLCDYESVNRNNLKKHQFMHKSNAEVKIRSCTKCNYVTKYGDNMKKHLMTHVDPTIQCDQCDYKARTLEYLKRHQLRHKKINEVQTFVCHLCDYMTKRKQDLKNHIVRHT